MTAGGLQLPRRARVGGVTGGPWSSPEPRLPLLTPPFPVLSVMPVLRVLRHDTMYVNQPLSLGLDPISEESHVGPMKMHMTPSCEVRGDQLYDLNTFAPQLGGGWVVARWPQWPMDTLLGEV